jgi:hypothetical protein
MVRIVPRCQGSSRNSEKSIFAVVESGNELAKTICADFQDFFIHKGEEKIGIAPGCLGLARALQFSC